MVRHVAPSKSLETESAGHLEETLELPFTIEHVVQHIKSGLVRLSMLYLLRRWNRTVMDRDRRWHRTAKDLTLAPYCQGPTRIRYAYGRTDAGTVLPRTTGQTTIAPIRLLSRPDDSAECLLL